MDATTVFGESYSGVDNLLTLVPLGHTKQDLDTSRIEVAKSDVVVERAAQDVNRGSLDEMLVFADSDALAGSVGEARITSLVNFGTLGVVSRSGSDLVFPTALSQQNSDREYFVPSALPRADIAGGNCCHWFI